MVTKRAYLLSVYQQQVQLQLFQREKRHCFVPFRTIRCWPFNDHFKCLHRDEAIWPGLKSCRKIVYYRMEQQRVNQTHQLLDCLH